MSHKEFFHRSKIAVALGAISTLFAFLAAPLQHSWANAKGEAAPPATIFLQFLVETARDSCYAIGDDPGRLRQFAERQKWSPPTPEMVKKFDSTLYKLLNGWTFEAHGRPFAVLQTESTADHTRSCSIATKLDSEQEYEELKAAWDKIIVAKRHMDSIKPEKLSHLDAMTRDASTELASTISFHLRTMGATLLVTAMPRLNLNRRPGSSFERKSPNSQL